MALIMVDRRKPNPNIVELSESIGELVEKVDIIAIDLSKLEARFDEHESSESKNMAEMIAVMTDNTKTIQDLALKTQTIIELTTDAQGFVRMTKRIGGFIAWCAKMGSFIGIFAAVIYWMKHKLGL